LYDRRPLAEVGSFIKREGESREHAVALLDALAFERAVDAAWTSHRSRKRAQRQALRGHPGASHAGAWTLGGRRGSFSTDNEKT
jgi:hypothetical protein